MTLLYDNDIFDMQTFGGISLYFSSIIKELKLIGEEVCLPYDYSGNYHLKESLKQQGISPHRELIPLLNIKGAWRVKKILDNNFPFLNTRSKNTQAFTKNLRKNDFDILHLTYYRSLKETVRKPVVVTVYDMIHERFPEQFVGSNDSSLKKAACQKATKILAISHTTKKDLMTFFDIPEDKIEVVHLGFDKVIQTLPHNDLNDLLKSVFSKKVIFFNGSRGGYKNFERFIQGVAPLLDKYDINLLCSGTRFSDHEKKLIKELGVEDRVMCSFLTDLELKFVYENSQLFIFPSLYEGFGIPLTEAMVYNCPMVLSDNPCFREVAGDTALYFDPYKVEDIREKIAFALDNTELRHNLVEMGKIRYENFGGWSRVAKDTRDFYKGLL